MLEPGDLIRVVYDDFEDYYLLIDIVQVDDEGCVWSCLRADGVLTTVYDPYFTSNNYHLVNQKDI